MKRRDLAAMPLIAAVLVCLAFAAPAQAAWERYYLQYGGETVCVLRDSYGVPHIYAPSEAALFYANGYTTAEDRLYQLELYRRDGKGTLAALLGASYVDHDQQVRREGYTEAERQAQFDALPAAFQTMLESYRDGINAYIDEAIADPDSKLPKQFWDLATVPEPWTVTDSMAIIAMMVRRFGATGGSELDNQAYLDANGWEAFNTWFPLNDPTAPCTIPDAEAPPEPGVTPAAKAAAETVPPRNSYPGIPRRIIQRMHKEQDELLRVLEKLGLPTKLGSFADVVTPTKSATGNPMLLGCPQMGYDEPQIANEADLHAPGLDVAGMQFAGCPSILIGRNRDLAWTTTSGISDNIDIVIETLNPLNSLQYWYQGAWHDVEHRVEQIDVAGGSPVSYDVYRTVHGPVLAYDLGTSQAFVAYATFWNDETSTIQAFADYNRAATIAEFQQGVEKIVTSHNFLCADRFGNIGYWHAGRYPLRAPGVDPRLPMGGEGDQEWTGFWAFADLPQLLNPAQGYFANWNNKPVYWWDHGDARAWVGWQHVQLIMDLMDPDSSVTFDEMKAIPYNISSQGTYEQAVEVGADLGLPAVNIVPPGQSGFIDKNGIYDSNFLNQKTLYQTWNYKPFLFVAPGEISGHVTVSGTGAPVLGAIVEAYDGDVLQGSVASGVDGAYAMGGLPASSYRVVAHAVGYVRQTIPSVSVAADEVTTLDIALVPSGLLMGQVRERGTTTNLAGATVEAYLGGELRGTAITDAKGIYVIDRDLPAGTYTVKAASPGYLTQTKAGIVVTSGVITYVNFGLEQVPSVKGQVRVVGSGVPIAGATVSINAWGMVPAVVSVTTDAKGIYAMPGGLPSGTYTLWASKAGYVTQRKVNIATTEGVTAYVNFNLQVSGRLRGQVKDKVSGTPIIGATVVARKDGIIRATATTVAPWGIYEMDSDLPAGTYVVGASATGYLGQTRKDVTVTSGATTYVNFSLQP